jgi:hypothetical protein
MSSGFVDRRLENQWDRQLEEGRPDSRLRTRDKGRIFRAHMWWEPVFCSSCSEGPFGYVTSEFFSHVFYLCDACVAKNGEPPAQKVPNS